MVMANVLRSRQQAGFNSIADQVKGKIQSQGFNQKLQDIASAEAARNQFADQQVQQQMTARTQQQQQAPQTLQQYQQQAAMLPQGTAEARRDGTYTGALTRSAMNPQAPQATAQQIPAQQYGLGGAEQALTQGFMGAGSALGTGAYRAVGSLGGDFGGFTSPAVSGNFSGRASSVDPLTGQPLFNQAAQGVDRFSGAGLAAQQQQAALSGALGSDAQREAMAGFMESPAQQFLREQGELGIINQASALGGLGGGNVQRELARFGTGLAAQDFQNQFNRLGDLSSQGLAAAGQAGQFLSQAGQQQGNLAAQNAQLSTQASLANAANRLAAARDTAQLATQAGLQGQANRLAQARDIADIQNQQGINIANLAQTTGRDFAQGRMQAGRDIASQVGQSTSALANLAGQQGGVISDFIGGGASNIANLLSGAGQYGAGQQMDLAKIRANLATGQGSQVAQAQQAIGQAQAGGILGKSDAISGTVMDAAKTAAYFSDKRLKKDIKKLGSAKGVNIYEWAWNGLLDLKGKAVGVLAQEVEKIIPNSVVETETGYKAVRYDIVKEFINA
jgi:hypothetical protein